MRKHLDHVIPESKDDPTTYENLQVTCRKCNLQLKDISEEELCERTKSNMNISNRTS